jgi:hypothetical protein
MRALKDDEVLREPPILMSELLGNLIRDNLTSPFPNCLQQILF